MSRSAESDGGNRSSPAAAAVALTHPLDPFVPVLATASHDRPNSPGRQNQVRRRAFILATVRRLLVQVGCDNITIRGIAEASGFAVQTIYNLIGPRDKVIADAISQYARFVGRRVHMGGEHPNVLLALVSAWAQGLDHSPDYCRSNNLIYFGSSRDIYYSFRDNQMRGLNRLLRHQRKCGIIRDEIDIEVLADQLGLFASAMCLEWADRPFPVDVFYYKLTMVYADLLANALSDADSNAMARWIASLKKMRTASA